jgi:hypothetical protein
MTVASTHVDKRASRGRQCPGWLTCEVGRGNGAVKGRQGWRELSRFGDYSWGSGHATAVRVPALAMVIPLPVGARGGGGRGSCPLRRVAPCAFWVLLLSWLLFFWFCPSRGRLGMSLSIGCACPSVVPCAVAWGPSSSTAPKCLLPVGHTSRLLFGSVPPAPSCWGPVVARRGRLGMLDAWYPASAMMLSCCPVMFAMR